MSQKNGHSQREKWVRTKLELARLLGVSRTTLDNYTLLPGFPARAANGHFPLEQCRAFVAGQLGRNEEKRSLELQKLRDDVARGQLELMKASDEVMPIEFVSRVLAHQAISFRQVIQNSDLTDDQKETLTNAVLAIDMDAFIASMFAEAGARSAPGARNGGEADE
jgi:DNA-binding transcriptional MerR regulator